MSDTYTPEELDAFRDGGTPVEDATAPTSTTPLEDDGPSQMELDLRDGAAAAGEGQTVIVEPTTIRMVRDPETGKFVAKAPDAPAAPVAQTGGAAGAAPAQGQPPSGFVPHAALHAERAKTAEALRNLQLLQTRTNALLTQKTVEPFKMPDMLTEPEKYLEALHSRLSAAEETTQAQNIVAEQDRALSQDEAMFTRYVPDYAQASAHYVNERAKELTLFNTPEQARDILTNEVRQIAAESWRRGVPAAESIYRLAQARGYTPQAAGAAPQPQPTPQPQLGAPQARPTPAPQGANAGRPDPAAIVASVKAGQEASRTISGAGQAGAAQLDAEALLQMSDDEFASYLKLGQGRASNDRFREVAGF